MASPVRRTSLHVLKRPVLQQLAKQVAYLQKREDFLSSTCPGWQEPGRFEISVAAITRNAVVSSSSSRAPIALVGDEVVGDLAGSGARKRTKTRCA